MRRSPLHLLGALALICATVPARAADAIDWADITRRADEALAAIKTMQGRFVQVAPDGDVSRGAYYLRRPGRLRFEYDAPSGLLIVADGTTVAVADSKLNSFDRFPLSSMPLGPLLDSHARLSERGRVQDVRAERDRYFIRVGDRDGEMDERVILEFAAKDFALLGWSIVDQTGRRTRVTLRDNVIDAPLSARLFRIEDPNETRDRRR